MPITAPRAMRTALVLLASTTALCAFGGAGAQTPPPTSPAGPAPAQPDAPTPDIVVTGGRKDVETTIDRKSYSIAHDLQATTGSVADVMRNLPSVTVDVDGNPSLRGDPNVQILVDGRPSPQFNTGNRGAALQALGADGIERIEVLTNPPANFKPDGSAGVINIITKRRRGSRSASAQASLGSVGRFNLGTTGAVQLGRLNLHGALTLRHDIRALRFSDDKVLRDPATGGFQSAAAQRGTAGENTLAKIATLGADFDIGKADRISAEGTVNARSGHSNFTEQDQRLDANGAILARSGRDRPAHEQRTASTAMVRYHHDTDKSGNGLTLLAQRSEAWERRLYSITNSFALPAAAPTVQDQRRYLDQITREASAEYTAALPAQAKLILGYDLQRDDNLFDNGQTLATSVGGTPVPDPSLTNSFRYGQTIHAFYGSYERPFGTWTVLAGMRLEQASVQTHQVTSGQRGGYSYFRAYPNLHLTNKVTDHQTLSFSYGRRVIRPDAEDLDPYIYQQDAFTLRQGNPNLRPQEIQSFEAGWSYDRGSTSRSATLYLRDIRNAFTIVSTPISPTIDLITEENLGKSLSGGLELAASGKLIGKVDYNLSANLSYNRIDAANLGFTGTRSAFGYEAKGALDWHATGTDTLQINVATVGKRLTPQGYRRGYVAADLGYRHQLRSNIGLTATLSDLFASRREGLIVNTGAFREISTRQQRGRIVFVGVSWSLPGTKAKAAETFDYEK